MSRLDIEWIEGDVYVLSEEEDEDEIGCDCCCCMGYCDGPEDDEQEWAEKSY